MRSELHPKSGKSRETSISIGPFRVARYKVEELVYVDTDESFDLKRRVKKAVEQVPSIPSNVRSHAESVVSEVYGDLCVLWNPNEIGDVLSVMQRAGYRMDMDESIREAGITLGKTVKPEVVKRLANNSFATPEGRQNKDFQDFMFYIIKLRMGIRDTQ